MRRLLAAALVLAAPAAQALEFDGVVTRVSDGDTVWVRPDDPARRPVKIRLAGLDAPERCQAWGREAGAALSAQVLRQRVRVVTRARDDYGRAIGVLWLDDADVGAWLVAQGHAWNQRYKRHTGRYAALERDARAAGRGLFADPLAIEPRAFRRAHGPCP